MNHNIRLYLNTSLLGLTIMVAGISLFFGTYQINKAVISEAKNRISFDLRTTIKIYSNIEKQINSSLSLTALDQGWGDCVNGYNVPHIKKRLSDLSEIIGLDFSGFVRNDSTTICRQSGYNTTSPDPVINPVAEIVLKKKVTISGTFILTQEEIRAEDPKLADLSAINLINSSENNQQNIKQETSCLTIVTAVPVYENNLFLGVIYGGIILNNSTAIVDTVRETVFQNETFNGQNVGTVTIFLNNLRVSTNVLTKSGARAVGTLLSQEVEKKVLIEGETWIDRAFILNDWNISAYQGIEDYYGKTVGILSVGVIESKYAQFKKDTFFVFVVISIAGILIAVLLGFILSRLVLKPVDELINISKKVSEGDLSPKIKKISKGEIGKLQSTFLKMIDTLRVRDLHQKEENEKQLMMTQKQASVGRLAAGVAHEINNPLTGVLTFTYMLLRRDDLDEEMKSDLETIANATNRVKDIVKGLLNFSRQVKLNPEPSDINTIIKETIELIENQALIKRIRINFDADINIPSKILDSSQFQSVVMNMIINAIDATDPGGRISVSTRINLSTKGTKHKEIEIIIADNGSGIAPEQLDKLFDPFFTTKEVGKGTGLGLAVSLGIVEHHGGTISVESQPGEGSSFTIHLPLDHNNE